jgi:hypothetical protein
MLQDVYTTVITYTFTAGGETWAVLDFTDDHIELEETRKNGQEDSHCYPELRRRRGRWELEQYSREQIEMYFSSKTASALEVFFNEHGPPEL